MAEYLIQDTTLGAIADAINAKTGGSSAMTPAEMATEIAAIPSGGGITPTGTKQISITQNGTTTEDVTQYANAEITVNVPSGASLPSVIGKIDGGSFTFTSNTLTGDYNVPHNLGVVPTGVAVWSEDVTADTSVRVEVAYMVFSGRYIVVQFNTNGANRDVIADVPSGDLSASSFKTTVSANYYKAGATYKWLAWA